MLIVFDCVWLCVDCLFRQELQTDIDGLNEGAIAADVNLHNTFNEFLLLSNSQFIENVGFGFVWKNELKILFSPGRN